MIILNIIIDIKVHQVGSNSQKNRNLYFNEAEYVLCDITKQIKPLVISAFKTEERREIIRLIKKFRVDMTFKKV